MDLIRRLNNEDIDVNDELKNLLIIPIAPIFHNFPMVGLNPVLYYIHVIFTFEPLPALSFGILHMCKEYASRMLSEPFSYYKSIVTVSGEKRKYNSIEDLKYLNSVILYIVRSFPGFNLHVDF